MMTKENLLYQHPWSSTIEMAIDLEAMGIGGKSSIFQVLDMNIAWVTAWHDFNEFILFLISAK